MSLAARNHYLENEVLTATPQRLRKMLIDGAWRFCTQAVDALEEGRNDDAIGFIERANLVLGELLSGIKPSYEISKPVSELYLFMIRELLEARRELSATRLRGILEVLDLERETWRQVCEAVPHRLAHPDEGGREILARDAEQILAKRQNNAARINPAPTVSSGFTIDA